MKQRGGGVARSPLHTAWKRLTINVPFRKGERKCVSGSERRKEASKQGRLKAPPNPILSGNTSLREFPPAATERSAAVSTSLLGAARDFAFSGGDFPTPPAGPLWIAEYRPPPAAKSSGGDSVGRRVAQRPGEGAGAFPAWARPRGPFPEGWLHQVWSSAPPLPNLAATAPARVSPPRPAAKDSTAGFPPGPEEIKPAGAGAVYRPGPPRVGMVGPDSWRAVESEGIEYLRKDDLPGRPVAGRVSAADGRGGLGLISSPL